MHVPSPPPFIERFSALASDYDVVLSDVWGIVHNGLSAHQEACAALRQFRERGGTVVLITNAPRPGDAVTRQIERFGVPRDTYDAIVSSGDVTRAAVRERPGQTIFHLGPERDRPIFAGLDVAFAPLERADYVVCSGLFDDHRETPDSYRDMLAAMRARGLFMICGNPDLVVERGHELVYCAGALADAYVELGGEVLYAGKPYPPIYSRALALAEAARAGPVARARVLAIGDSVRTDLTGAVGAGLDCLFVTAGIHAEELGTRDDPDPAVLAELFAAAGHAPKAVMRRLAW
jgi:HAD superfamily hydrolase (TIGR01459 family)